MKKKLQKVFAMLLTLSMVMSLMSVAAFAAGDTSAQQIVNEGGVSYFKADGTPVTDGGAYDVALSKTIEGTDTENVFDITLGVQTSVDSRMVTTSSADAAVTLTIDVSYSMVYSYNNIGNKTRLQIAKETACAFIDQYAASANGAKRMLAVTKFGDHANQVQGWIDVSSETNRDAVKAKINALTDAGATNYEGAALLTANQFYYGGQQVDAVKDIEHRYAIILSDGGPTTGYDGSRWGEFSNSITGPITHVGVTDWGSRQNMGRYYYQANAVDYDDVETMLNRITGATRGKAKLYLLGLGLSGEQIEWCTTDNQNLRNYTSIQFLQDMANAVGGTAYPNMANQSDMTTVYNTIINTIKTETVVEADAWIVEDPINSTNTPNVEFLDFYVDHDAVNYVNNEKIHWDLLQFTPTDVTVGGKTYKNYEIKYQVRLANEKVGFTPSFAYDTNGEAKFAWQYNNNGVFSNASAVFPVPAVEGYLGDLTFTKVDSVNSAATLDGAEFELRHDHSSDGCGCGVTISTVKATSADGGAVSFTGIPSGHTYKLIETKAPVDYKLPANDEIGTVTVAYGEVDATGITDGKVTNEMKDINDAGWAPEATKSAINFELADGEFSFKLEGVSDNAKSIIRNATNSDSDDEDALYNNVVFGEITFNKAGEYQFLMSEVDGEVEGVEYDNTSYLYTVTVSRTDSATDITYAVTDVAVEMIDPDEAFCGEEERDPVDHVHTSDCRNEQVEVVICGDEHHDDSCYSDHVLTCEKEEHSHDESCVDPADGETLICGKDLHAHDDAACYSDDVFTCVEEKHEDRHAGGCYSLTETETVFACVKEEHGHDESCVDPADGETLICGKDEHMHSDDICSTKTTFKLICTSEEDGHEHSKGCPTELPDNYQCGKVFDDEGHEHIDACHMKALADDVVPEFVNAKYTKYHVIHEYYTNGSFDGRSETETFDGLDVGTVVVANDVEKELTFNRNTYEFTSVRTSDPESPDVLVLDMSGTQTITLRYDRTRNTTPSTRNVTVTKVWDDDNDAAGERPASITVALLEDGEVYDTATLSEANGWRYTWTGLSRSSDWSVSEVDVPTGYTSEVSGFTITNTYEVEEFEEEDVPLGDTPDTHEGDEEILEDEEIPLGDIPETGDVSALWLALTAISGSGLVGLNLMGSKKREDEE